MVTNYSITASVLHKIHNAICYHRVRDAHYTVTLRVGWIPGEYNLSYLLTKTTTTGNTRQGIVESIFYNRVVVIREKDES